MGCGQRQCFLFSLFCIVVLFCFFFSITELSFKVCQSAVDRGRDNLTFSLNHSLWLSPLRSATINQSYNNKPIKTLLSRWPFLPYHTPSWCFMFTVTYSSLHCGNPVVRRCSQTKDVTVWDKVCCCLCLCQTDMEVLMFICVITHWFCLRCLFPHYYPHFMLPYYDPTII